MYVSVLLEDLLPLITAHYCAPRDPSTAVAAGPSNIPPPLINPNGVQEQRPSAKRKRHTTKRKRAVGESNAAVAGQARSEDNTEHPEGTGGAQAGNDREEEEEEGVWTTPWLESLGSTAYESKEQRYAVRLAYASERGTRPMGCSLRDRLHDEIIAFYSYMTPTPDERHARAMVISQVSDVVRRRFPKSSVDTFGSVAQNLYLPDACVLPPPLSSPPLAFPPSAAILVPRG